MALGDVVDHGNGLISVEVCASRTTTNGTPSASASAGVAMSTILDAFDYWALGMPSDLSLVAVSTAGSGTMTLGLKDWMRFGAVLNANGDWCPANVNGAATISEADTDMIRFAEPVSLSAHADRFYTEVTSIGGTATAVTVRLFGRKAYGPGRL